ncbi:MAG: hypothetical protein KDK99_18375, partial [Verrucomicrobiales bacterium]|nr:hypothetical protein [Verrucomicrobiales bacterium]
TTGRPDAPLPGIQPQQHFAQRDEINSHASPKPASESPRRQTRKHPIHPKITRVGRPTELSFHLGRGSICIMRDSVFQAKTGGFQKTAFVLQSNALPQPSSLSAPRLLRRWNFSDH